MKIYLICPVRNCESETLRQLHQYVLDLEAQGHEVHFPPRDVSQVDPTGAAICAAHRAAMLVAHEVHVFWDIKSSGSHFDLGMAYALGKKIVPAANLQEDQPGKSYWKAVIACN